jgi:hypothetical protein
MLGNTRSEAFTGNVSTPAHTSEGTVAINNCLISANSSRRDAVFFFLRRNVLTSSALIGVPVCQTQAFWPAAHATRDLGTAVESDQDVFELKCV